MSELVAALAAALREIAARRELERTERRRRLALVEGRPGGKAAA